MVFFGYRTTDKSGAIVPIYGGTGFFVVHDQCSHLITAGHVAEALTPPFVIGTNDKNGQLCLLDVDHVDWTFHPDSNVDVAMTIAGLSEDADWLPFYSIGFASPGAAGYDSVGAGDLVYIVGQYRLFPGKAKIQPGVHTGHVFMTPDEDLPVKNRITGKITNVRGYLVEAQTLEGLSGAPVFVRYTNRLNMWTGSGGAVAYTDSVYLMGLWSGAWDSPSGSTLSEQLGREARVPVGMGITIPAAQILEVLELPKLREQRARLLADLNSGNAANMDSAFPTASDSKPEGDENPDHREDFNRLVGAASKSKPKGGRT